MENNYNNTVKLSCFEPNLDMILNIYSWSHSLTLKIKKQAHSGAVPGKVVQYRTTW